jgi:hypothetical protein
MKPKKPVIRHDNRLMMRNPFIPSLTGSALRTAGASVARRCHRDTIGCGCGAERAKYGAGMLRQLATDLTHCFGRGFRLTNLKPFRKLFSVDRHLEKGQTPSDPWEQNGPTLILQTSPEESNRAALLALARRFPLPGTLRFSHFR